MDIILKYTLKKIQEQVANIPNINYGGCCHFAKLISKQLDQRNIKYKVSLFGAFENLTTLTTLSLNIKNRDYVNSINHVFLKIDKYYFDSTIISSDYMKTDHSSYGELKNSDLNYLDLRYYANNAIWNPQFNKKRYHPIINKIIIDQFKIYDKLIKQQENGRK